MKESDSDASKNTVPVTACSTATGTSGISMASRSSGQLFSPTTPMISKPLCHSLVSNLQPFRVAIVNSLSSPIRPPRVAATASQLSTVPLLAPAASANMDPTQNHVLPPVPEQAAAAQAAATQFVDSASIAAATTGMPQPLVLQALVSLGESSVGKQQRNVLASATTSEDQQRKHGSGGRTLMQIDPNTLNPLHLTEAEPQLAPNAWPFTTHEENAPPQLTSQPFPAPVLASNTIVPIENTGMENAPGSGSDSILLESAPSEPLPALSPYLNGTAPTKSAFTQRSGFEDYENSINQGDSFTGIFFFCIFKTDKFWNVVRIQKPNLRLKKLSDPKSNFSLDCDIGWAIAECEIAY